MTAEFTTSLLDELKRADGFGALHVVIEDGNIDDANIRACLADPAITSVEARLAWWLLMLTEDERQDALIKSGLFPEWADE